MTIGSGFAAFNTFTFFILDSWPYTNTLTHRISQNKQILVTVISYINITFFTSAAYWIYILYGCLVSLSIANRESRDSVSKCGKLADSSVFGGVQFTYR